MVFGNLLGGNKMSMLPSMPPPYQPDSLVEKNLNTQFYDGWNFVADHIAAYSKEKGWAKEDRNPGELIALMHSELSEALEALRHGNPDDQQCPGFKNVEIELADCIIRIMDASKAKGWNVGAAILAKVRFNDTREYRHGGKLF